MVVAFTITEINYLVVSIFRGVLLPGMWKRKLEAEAVEATLFLWKRKREKPAASAST